MLGLCGAPEGDFGTSIWLRHRSWGIIIMVLVGEIKIASRTRFDGTKYVKISVLLNI